MDRCKDKCTVSRSFILTMQSVDKIKLYIYIFKSKFFLLHFVCYVCYHDGVLCLCVYTLSLCYYWLQLLERPILMHF